MGYHSASTSDVASSARGGTGLPVAVLACGAVLCALVALVLVAGSLIGSQAPADSSGAAGQSAFPPAPDIEGIDHWLNSERLSVADLRGNMVLLDFWTYSCVNCIRTLPQLKAWQERYADYGLVIVGIHTPEFEFEKDPTNVQLAADSHGVNWPIALDNEYVTWDNYGNAFWPTKYLIDARGRLRYHRVGEGNYASFEEQLRSLLVEAGQDLSDNPPTLGFEHDNDARYDESADRVITPELYTGYARGDFQREYYGVGYVGQAEYYALPGQVLNLEAPDYLEPDLLYFHGVWRNEDQRAVHAREASEFEDYVALVYSARSVNAVLSPPGEETLKVRVWMDGEYLTEDNRGADVMIGPDGESYLWVDQARMYRVVETPAYLQRKTLRLSANAEGFAIYAFTFGIYAEARSASS